MRIVFMGSSEASATALRAILKSPQLQVVGVVTQPDRPSGRHQHFTPCACKAYATQRGLTNIISPEKVNAPEVLDQIEALRPDVIVVVAFGQFLGRRLLSIPPRGCINGHFSLLPNYRGAAPVQAAIAAGDEVTGVTIMQMDIGLDTGDMCVLERLPIAHDDTTGSLHDKLATLGGRLIVEALEMSACGGLHRTPQPAEGVTYAHKIEKAESAMDWRLSATVLDRRLRAFTPFPGGSTQLGEETIKLWAAVPEPFDGSAQPGQVLAADAQGVLVACGEGALRLTQLQRAGGKKLAAADFLRGFELPVGSQLQLPHLPEQP